MSKYLLLSVFAAVVDVFSEAEAVVVVTAVVVFTDDFTFPDISPPPVLPHETIEANIVSVARQEIIFFIIITSFLKNIFVSALCLYCDYIIAHYFGLVCGITNL